MSVAAAFFYLFSGVAVASAFMVVASRNPVHSVLFLILAFVNAAGLFLLLGADCLPDLPKWHEPVTLLGQATLLTVARPGHPRTGFHAHLHPVMAVAVHRLYNPIHRPPRHERCWFQTQLGASAPF